MPNRLGDSDKPDPNRDASMTRERQWVIIGIAIAVAATVGISSIAFSFAHGPSPAGTPQGSYPTGQGPVGSMMGGWSYLDSSQLEAVTASQPVQIANDTITYGGPAVKILVLMGPMTQGESMYSFVIDNVTNPTLVFPQGTKVTMVVVNVDTDAYHALTLTALSPPYAYNFMPGMMGSLASTSVMPPHSSGFATQQISFVVNGDMYYVCPVAGHAQSGMYGLIRVE